MTVTYNDNFLKAIFRWHGSVWKYVWKEALVWLVLYYIIRILFHFAPVNDHDDIVRLVGQFNDYTKGLPLEFLVGFYVTQTISRWWNQAMVISSPHELMGVIVGFIHGMDEESARIRHTVARYLILYYALAYRLVSNKMRKLFPSNDSFVKIELMTQEEKNILDGCPIKDAAPEMVYQWVIEIIRQKIGNKKIILDRMNDHRGNIKAVTKHNDVPLPLVYTQTVTIAVYGYFAFALIGHQFIQGDNNQVDIIVPVFTLLRFIFYIGWLKVAEYLSKPFDNDDDDVDLCLYLTFFCDVCFTLANYSTSHKPLKSWEKDESKFDHVKSSFSEGITKFENCGKKISKNMKKVMGCAKV